MKEKFAQIVDKSAKQKLLSMLPKSWSANKIHKEFGVTKHAAKSVKELVLEKGIFSNSDQKIGPQSIKSETVDRVIAFYRDSDISKIMPGMRDCISYNNNMEKIKVQRRLMLFNLKEVYAMFKDKYPEDKIGFSKFATLRPKGKISLK